MIAYAQYPYLTREKHTGDRLVEDEVGTLLVYGVVREMHELIIQVLRTRRPILLCSQPGKALLVHEDAKRVNPSN
jgi:hypothetical protein